MTTRPLKWLPSGLAAGLAALASLTANGGEPISPMCEKTLPASAVGAAAGIKVHLIGRDPHKGAGGDCNWAVDGDAMALMLRTMFGGASDVQSYRNVTIPLAKRALSGK